MPFNTIKFNTIKFVIPAKRSASRDPYGICYFIKSSENTRGRSACFEACLGGREGIYPQRGTQVGGFSRFPVFKRRPGGIGNPIETVEHANNPSRIDQGCIADGRLKGRPRNGNFGRPVGEHRLGKGDQQIAVLDAGAVPRTAGQNIEIDVVTIVVAARTEHLRMAGGSIGTSVDGRHPPGEKLDLGSRNRAYFLGKFAHGLAGQILVCAEIEEAARFIGHQGQRPANA